jgi:hypothetical protein
MNGKTGEFVRWMLGLALAAVVAYYTAIGAMSREIGEVKATEQSHFSEVLRRLDDLKSDVRDLRNERRQP